MQDQDQPKNQAVPSSGTGYQPPADEPQSVAINKEGEPLALRVADANLPALESLEISASQTPEVKIPDELKHVMETGSGEKNLSLPKGVSMPQVTPAKESVPEIVTPTGTIKLPMTYTQAVQKKKMTKIIDSPHWLAALIMYLWRKYDPDRILESKKS